MAVPVWANVGELANASSLLVHHLWGHVECGCYLIKLRSLAICNYYIIEYNLFICFFTMNEMRQLMLSSVLA